LHESFAKFTLTLKGAFFVMNITFSSSHLTARQPGQLARPNKAKPSPHFGAKPYHLTPNGDGFYETKTNTWYGEGEPDFSKLPQAFVKPGGSKTPPELEVITSPSNDGFYLPQKNLWIGTDSPNGLIVSGFVRVRRTETMKDAKEQVDMEKDFTDTLRLKLKELKEQKKQEAKSQAGRHKTAAATTGEETKPQAGGHKTAAATTVASVRKKGAKSIWQNWFKKES
jgi:hypothetical protein